jgi:glutamate synthase (NADPH/NADH) large chain
LGDGIPGLIAAHAKETGSRKATDILQNWDLELRNFVQVCPKEMLDKLVHPISEDVAAIPAE